jgi:hypothetical protein
VICDAGYAVDGDKAISSFIASCTGDSVGDEVLPSSTWKNVKECLPIPCIEVGGFYLSCTSEDPDSTWNGFSTDVSNWKSWASSVSADEFPTTSTTQPKSDCKDIPDWQNVQGYSCDWYAGSTLTTDSTSDFCAFFGGSLYADSEGVTPEEACCACGGGVLPKVEEVVETCQDIEGWTDSLENSCGFYEVATDSLDPCVAYGSNFENNGYTAAPVEGGNGGACCACGGGLPIEVGVIECAFTIDNEVLGFWLNGEDVTASLPQDDLAIWQNPTFWSFPEYAGLGRQLAFLGEDTSVPSQESGVNCPNHEECAGIYLGCKSTAPDSPWNFIQSDLTRWKTYSSNDLNDLSSTDGNGNPEWVSDNFDDSLWLPPLPGGSGSTCQECLDFRPEMIPVWGDDGSGHGGVFTWFRTAICPSLVPEFTGYDINRDSSLRNLGDTRPTECAPGYVGTPVPVTCGTNAKWIPPSGCVKTALVTCEFTVQGTALNLYIDGDENVATGDYSDYEVLKTVSFYESSSGRQVIAVSAQAEPCDPAGDSNALPADWYSVAFDDADWAAPISTQGALTDYCVDYDGYVDFKGDSCDAYLIDPTTTTLTACEQDGVTINSDGINSNEACCVCGGGTPTQPAIWAEGAGSGHAYSFFRTSLCSPNDVGHAGYTFQDAVGDNGLGAYREVVCEEYYEGSPTGTFCQSDGTWTLPVGCAPTAQVTCTFTIDNVIQESVHVDGIDKSDLVTGDLRDFQSINTITFSETQTGRQVLAFSGIDFNTCIEGGCENSGGMFLYCESTNPESAWNFVESDLTQWLTFSASTAPQVEANWYSLDFDDSNWNLPLESPIAPGTPTSSTSFRDVNFPGIPAIWGQSFYFDSSSNTIPTGFKYAWFRTGVCDRDPPPTEGYVNGQVCNDFEGWTSGSFSFFVDGDTGYTCQDIADGVVGAECTDTAMPPNFVPSNSGCCICGGGIEASLSHHIGSTRQIECAPGYTGTPADIECLNGAQWETPAGCSAQKRIGDTTTVEHQDVPVKSDASRGAPWTLFAVVMTVFFSAAW